MRHYFLTRACCLAVTFINTAQTSFQEFGKHLQPKLVIMQEGENWLRAQACQALYANLYTCDFETLSPHVQLRKVNQHDKTDLRTKSAHTCPY